MSELDDPKQEFHDPTKKISQSEESSNEDSPDPDTPCKTMIFNVFNNKLDVTVTVIPVKDTGDSFPVKSGVSKSCKLNVPNHPKSKNAADYLQVKVSEGEIYWIWAGQGGIPHWSVSGEPINGQPINQEFVPLGKPKTLSFGRDKSTGAPWIVGEVDVPEETPGEEKVPEA